ncbi:hypothetical protein RHGRI_030981 [Rhododendron griersonianum]|uniref:Uncharacterized protein n=1 Tax=Rhododendron griersonianum TaxID=479676 RepID=A0AAV6I6L1_9ERIC|nr:hypothetical protein RHGRI_030981 [Rhododendron griersonianum]
MVDYLHLLTMFLYVKVQPLRDNNIAVHVHEPDIQIIKAMARKGNATYVGSGKKNTQEIQRLEAIAKKGKAVYIDSGKENSQLVAIIEIVHSYLVL